MREQAGLAPIPTKPPVCNGMPDVEPDARGGDPRRKLLERGEGFRCRASPRADASAALWLAARSAPAGEARAANDEAPARGTAFAPIVVEEALRRSEAPVARNEGGGTSVIEIVIGAATVRVAPGIDAATLTTVLRAVKRNIYAIALKTRRAARF